MTARRPPRRRRGRGLRPAFILVKHAGLFLHLGGLGALGAIGLLAPAPASVGEWMLLKGVMRAVFWPCVFGGLVIVIAAGLALFSRHPRHFLATRWFRAKLAILAVLIPTLHVWARGRVQAFYAAIETHRLDALPGMWRDVTIAFIVALLAMALVAALARTKPRLGERVGSRAP